MIKISEFNSSIKIYLVGLGAGIFLLGILRINFYNDLTDFMIYYLLSGIVGSFIGFIYLCIIKRLNIHKGKKYEVRDNLFSSKIASEIRAYPLTLLLILLILTFIFISDRELHSAFYYVMAACLGANMSLGYFLNSGVLDVYKEGVLPSEDVLKEEEIIIDKTFHNLNMETKIFFITLLLFFLLAILYEKSFFAPMIMSAVVGASICFIYFFLLGRINVYKGKKYSFLYGWSQWKKISWSVKIYETVCILIGIIGLWILYRNILDEELSIWRLERAILRSSSLMFFVLGMLLSFSYFYATKRLNVHHTT